LSPTLQNGNVVLIDLGRNKFRGGKIFAIGVGDVIQVKRLDILAVDRMSILSDNPLYDNYELRPDEFRIICQVIWAARTFI
jgi:phage repressor protein C with HTH and peptisase S24 domain